MAVTTLTGAIVIVAVSDCRKRNLDRSDHLDHITQAHGIGEPPHGLFGITTALSITGLIFMRFGKQGQPTEATGLNDREVEICLLGVSNTLTFLLNQES